MNTNILEQVGEEVNEIDNQLDRIFGKLKAVEGLESVFRESREAIERGFCSKHTKFKEDLFGDGCLSCSECFYENFHNSEVEHV